MTEQKFIHKDWNFDKVYWHFVNEQKRDEEEPVSFVEGGGGFKSGRRSREENKSEQQGRTLA